ncbi:hypothetical protein Tco_0482188 [Tanacetum coccineum]
MKGLLLRWHDLTLLRGSLLPTSVFSSSGELSASVEREFVGDASVGDGGDQGFDSVGGQDNVEPIVPITEHVETETLGPKRTKVTKRDFAGCEIGCLWMLPAHLNGCEYRIWNTLVVPLLEEAQGSGCAAGSFRAEEVIGAGLEEIYVPEWIMTRGFELNDGHS